MIVIAVIIVAVLASQPKPEFFMTVHVYYGTAQYSSISQLPADALLANETATVTLSGPTSLTLQPTLGGLTGTSIAIPAGNYTLSANSQNFSGTTSYMVGSSCNDKTVSVDGTIVCHALLRVSRTV